MGLGLSSLSFSPPHLSLSLSSDHICITELFTVIQNACVILSAAVPDDIVITLVDRLTDLELSHEIEVKRTQSHLQMKRQRAAQWRAFEISLFSITGWKGGG